MTVIFVWELKHYCFHWRYFNALGSMVLALPAFMSVAFAPDMPFSLLASQFFNCMLTLL